MHLIEDHLRNTNMHPVIKCFIETGSNMNQPNTSTGLTLLDSLLKSNPSTLLQDIKYLIGFGADPTIMSQPTSLILAVRTQRIDIIQEIGQAIRLLPVAKFKEYWKLKDETGLTVE